MQLFVLVAFAVTCVGTALLGARLVLAGLRTRTAPELCYGLGLLLSGTSAALRILVHGILAGRSEFHILAVVAALCSGVSLVAISTGIRVIFRPGQGWPRVLVGVFACAACAGIAITALGDLDPRRPLHYRPLDLAMLLSTLWGALECWRYYAKMRRRLALGLAEPLATSQFALWGASFTLGGFASILYLFVPILTGVALLESPVLVVSVQALMVGMTAGTWLAFYPPALYRRYIVAHPGQAAARARSVG